MFKKILLALVIVVGAIVIFALTKPNTFHYERSALMNAPAERIFPYFNDFQNWAKWSPFEKFDPNMKRTIGGSPNGLGAIYEWDGNKDVGTGRMEIVESTPHSLVKMKLDFLKPFASTHEAIFTLTPEGPQTKVTWAMSGVNNFVSKLMLVFMSMDKMMGVHFDEGLNNLKVLVEQPAAETPAEAPPAD
ncbi:MAG: SRPBCC family protein [Bdellovibrionales bacterium]